MMKKKKKKKILILWDALRNVRWNCGLAKHFIIMVWMRMWMGLDLVVCVWSVSVEPHIIWIRVERVREAETETEKEGEAGTYNKNCRELQWREWKKEREGRKGEMRSLLRVCVSVFCVVCVCGSSTRINIMQFSLGRFRTFSGYTHNAYFLSLFSLFLHAHAQLRTTHSILSV